jgi:hypothetical protein
VFWRLILPTNSNPLVDLIANIPPAPHQSSHRDVGIFSRPVDCMFQGTQHWTSWTENIRRRMCLPPVYLVFRIRFEQFSYWRQFYYTFAFTVHCRNLLYLCLIQSPFYNFLLYSLAQTWRSFTWKLHTNRSGFYHRLPYVTSNLWTAWHVFSHSKCTCFSSRM